MRGRDDRRQRGTGTVIAVSLSRRRVCRWMVVPAVQFLAPSLTWANIGHVQSARVWPAQEYTRVVFEAPEPIAYRLETLTGPHRVILEFDNMRLTAELAQLPTRIEASDPYIASVRFGTRGDTLRIVFDLKSETRTQVFGLKPVAEFGHRVVLDL